MTEFEKLKRAQKYINMLANGTDPISEKELTNDSILNNVRLSRCFFFVDEILKKVIANGGEVGKRSSRSTPKIFVITEEQKDRIALSENEIYLSELVNRINAEIDESTSKKMQLSWISGWFVKKGFMDESFDEKGKRRRSVSEEGEKIGLRKELRQSMYGTYPVTLLDKDAQNFIIDNLEAILLEK